MIKRFALPSTLALLFSGAAFADTVAAPETKKAAELGDAGYYATGRIIGAFDNAVNMELTSPRVASRVGGPDTGPNPSLITLLRGRRAPPC